MPMKLGKNLNGCFSKMKRQSQHKSLPRTQAEDHSRPLSPSSILIKNYNSLYNHTSDHYSASSLSTATSSASIPPDSFLFATAFASDRFFFSSPGHSNSIIESSTSNDDVLFTNGVAVPTYSPDPYKDFRQSMQEMVDAREQMDVKNSSWEFLHELLLCYLAINPKSTHKFILRAFADLVVSVMPSPEDSDCRKKE